MIRVLKICLILFLLLIVRENTYAQTTITNFPYNQSFRSSTLPTGWVKPGIAGNSATPLSVGLELTPDRTNSAPADANNRSKFGGVVLEGVDFNSSNGITISFEFSITGGALFDGNYGDGFSFFLFDSSKQTTLGAPGRGLGYSQGDGIAGLDGGYLGIGFDVFGNFKARDNGRSGTIPSEFPNSLGANHITLRGAMGSEGRTYGYPTLYTQKVDKAQNTTDNLRAVLNPTNGVISYSKDGLTSTKIFELRSTALSIVKGDINYRRAKITLLPRSGGGFRVSVEVSSGTNVTSVIQDFEYPTQVTYTNNAIGISNPSTVTYDTPIPAKFQLGFAAATGFATQRHLIRDVEVSIPYMAETVEDINNNLCMAYSQQSITINPFANDKFYNGALTGIPTSGNNGNYIDFNSIQFSDANDNVLSNTGVGDKTYVQTGVGTWKSSGATGLILFTPEIGFIGTATIYYTAKGLGTNSGPFNQDIYRSAPQKISVNVVRCGGVINPQIPAGGVSRSGK